MEERQMTKTYDYVAAATQTVVNLLQDLVAERSTMFFMHGYVPEGHDEYVSTILDYLELEADGPESAFALNSMTLCLDQADWKMVCQECGIDYHADLAVG